MATTEAPVVESTAEGHSTSVADKLTTQEKLLLAQAVYKVGAVAWTTISQLLTSHPICISRPADTFSPSACEELYIALMTSIGQNVPAPDAMKPQNKIHLLLARTFYFARLEELKLEIEQYENRFTILIGEINALKGGQMDEAIREEIKAATVKKYGPRVLQWIPDEKEVEKAIEDGPIRDGEIDPDRQEAQKATTELAVASNKSGEEPVSAKAISDAGQKVKSAKSSSKAKLRETPRRSGDQSLEQKGEPTAVEETGNLDGQVDEARRDARRSPTREKKSQVSPRKGKSATKEEPTAPDEIDEPKTNAENVQIHAPEESTDTPKPSPAASELSPLPSQPTDTNDTTPKPVPSPSPADHATRSSKRKASTQPRGAPASKRGGRARRGTSPAATTSDHQSDEDTETVDEPEKEPDVEPEETGRGRRQSKRHTRGHESPPQSTRTRGSSPATSRRAPSVSSSASTPAAVEEKRTLRGKARGMRDEVVSKSVREQSAAVESAKEEEDDAEEARPTRSSRRGKKEPSPVDDKKDMGKKKRTGKTPTLQGNDDDEVVRTSKRGDHDREAASATPAASVGEGTKRGPRRSEPKDVRATQKILYNLLDTITGHQHGGVFSTGVKKSDAPDYASIIKKPMDLKKVRQRIRDGHITNIDEFERDVFLIFANAMMYNEEGSQVFEMAQEMFRATEAHIIHFRSMQADMGK